MGQHFYGTIEGKGSGSVHAAGTKASGISGHIRGWEVGARVTVHHNTATGQDIVTIYATSGSHDSGHDVMLMEFTADSIPTPTLADHIRAANQPKPKPEPKPSRAVIAAAKLERVLQEKEMRREAREEARQEQREQRRRYMDHEISHREYFTWLAEFIGADASHLPVNTKRILASRDEHLNDIPMKLWDAKHPAIQALAFAKGLAWSESDTTCTLKTIAKNTAEAAS